MSRYIDAEALLATIRPITEEDYRSATLIAIAKELYINAIKKAPTADVVEVRHGEWEICGAFDDFLKCSLCHNSYPWMTASYYNYCPECGAKMDGEKSENGK